MVLGLSPLLYPLQPLPFHTLSHHHTIRNARRYVRSNTQEHAGARSTTQHHAGIQVIPTITHTTYYICIISSQSLIMLHIYIKSSIPWYHAASRNITQHHAAPHHNLSLKLPLTTFIYTLLCLPSSALL